MKPSESDTRTKGEFRGRAEHANRRGFSKFAGATVFLHLTLVYANTYTHIYVRT